MSASTQDRDNVKWESSNSEFKEMRRVTVTNLLSPHLNVLPRVCVGVGRAFVCFY